MKQLKLTVCVCLIFVGCSDSNSSSNDNSAGQPTGMNAGTMSTGTGGNTTRETGGVAAASTSMAGTPSNQGGNPVNTGPTAGEMGGTNTEPGGMNAVMGGQGAQPSVCPKDTFLNVEAYQGPGGNYDAPRLEVSCTDTELVVSSNGMPHYTYVDRTPNGLRPQNFNWTIPLNPSYSMDTTPIPCLGTAGFSISGIPIYGPNEAQMPDPYGDPVANGVMDEAEGHTGGQADYHYHALIESAFRDSDGDGVPDLFDDERSELTGPSPILGYALDGFPIYGSRGCLDADCAQVVTFKSGYESTNYEMGTVGCQNNNDCTDMNAYTCAPTVVDGAVTTACVYKDYAWDSHEFREKQGDEWLDECNGRIGPDGTYRYHATSTFPYILGCYHGVITQNLQGVCPREGEAGGGMMQPGMGMGGGRMPPPEAQAACANSNDGDACSFMLNGMAINGVCRTPPGANGLACVPAMGGAPQP